MSLLEQFIHRSRYDWQRSRRLIVTCSLLTATMAALPASVLYRTEWYHTYGFLVINGVIIGLTTFVVASLARFDSAIDPRAFWRMQALSPIALLASKVVAVTIVVFVTPALLSIVDSRVGYGSALLDSSLEGIWRLMPVLTLVVFAICALTRSYKSILLLIIVISVLLLLFASSTQASFPRRVDDGYAYSEWRNLIVASLTFAVGALVVISYTKHAPSQKWALGILLALSVPLLDYVILIAQSAR